jgi:hypothetical protein
MNNIYTKLRELAKSIRAQNIFIASKEINGIHLFKNQYEFSKLQEIYLSYLYNYDSINRDIIIDKISEHVLDSDIMEDSYLLWKKKNIKKINIKDNKQNDLSLVTTRKIKFPKREI